MLTPRQELTATTNPTAAFLQPRERVHLENDRRLTIHRRTTTHHGASLKLLGHAAEYLTDSIATGNGHDGDEAAVREAVHLLMRTSREVFDDYAAANSRRHSIADWIMRGAVRVYGRAPREGFKDLLTFRYASYHRP
jgi:hypothetical protein